MTKKASESEVSNYVRELFKSEEVLKNVERYLKLQAQANAQLHLSQEVLPSPLHGQVVMALNGIRNALRSWKRKLPKLEASENNNGN